MPGRDAIRKSRAYRLHELTLALSVIRDALDGLRTGRHHQLVPLSGQLRALLIERSKKAKPLLISLAAELGVSLDIYAMPGVEDIDGLVKDGLVLEYSSPIFSYDRSFSGQTHLVLEKALDVTVIRSKTRTFSVRDVIKIFSQEAGGAHYDLSIDRNFFYVMNLNTPFGNVVAKVLFEIGEITVRLGATLIQHKVGQSMYLLTFIPEQAITKPCPLIDAHYPRTSMRFTLGITAERHLFVRIVEYTGAQHYASSAREMKIGGPVILVLSIEPRDDLETDIRLIVNGVDTILYNVKSPVQLYNSFYDYDVYFNRFIGNDSGGLEFGILHFLVYGGSNWAQRGQMIYYLVNEAQQKRAYRWLNVGQYGHKPAHGREFAFSTGTVLRTMGRTDEADVPKVAG